MPTFISCKCSLMNALGCLHTGLERQLLVLVKLIQYTKILQPQPHWLPHKMQPSSNLNDNIYNLIQLSLLELHPEPQVYKGLRPKMSGFHLHNTSVNLALTDANANIDIHSTGCLKTVLEIQLLVLVTLIQNTEILQPRPHSLPHEVRPRSNLDDNIYNLNQCLG